ncbi:hypothetical protein BJY04DRAFT_119496 [Aspergillus karnatakaensis]|uniref:uncharacterized protein n=1 Tax=Aspergillus karnatakaensis TaxID=1810916 RepID=UPI003CCDF1B5
MPFPAMKSTSRKPRGSPRDPSSKCPSTSSGDLVSSPYAPASTILTLHIIAPYAISRH